MRVLPLRRRLLPGLVALGLLAPGLSAAGPLPPGPGVGEGDSVNVKEGTYLRACGASANGTQTSNFGSFQALQGCTMVFEHSGQVMVLASASVGLLNEADSYEAQFRIDHNLGLTGDSLTERFVDVYPDNNVIKGGDGTDRNVAISAMYTVTAGSHTFDLLWKRSEGTATMEAIDANISVIYVPDGLGIQLCGQRMAGSWPNPTDTLTPSVKCSLTVTQPGRVFVSADGWLKLDSPSDDPYEAAHQIVMDGVTNGNEGVRYTDVYTNTTAGSLSGDGVDTTVANTQVFEVTAGTHEFTYMFRRQSGTDMVRMVAATLVALFVPDNSPYAKTCYDRGEAVSDDDGDTNVAFASCAVSVPSGGWVFVSSTSSVGLNPGHDAYEGVFNIGLDDLSPENPTSRYVNSYPDHSDGLDGSMADALLLPVTAGPHTFNLIGRRGGSGSAAVRVRYPVLFVLAPAANVFVPLGLRD